MNKKNCDLGRISISSPTSGSYWIGRVVSNPLYAYRMAHKLSTAKLAASVGMSQSAICRWEQFGLPQNGHGHDLLKSRIGLDLEGPDLAWKATKKEDYVNIGEAAIGAWSLQDQKRGEVKAFNSALRARKCLQRRDALELERLYRSSGRAENAIAMQSLMAHLRERQQAREHAILKNMAEDQEYADKWLAEHEDDPTLIESKDWKLYMSLPLTSDSKSDNWRDNTMDWASLHVVDSSEEAWLENAIIEKIDKENAGYFVELNYSNRGYKVSVMNDRGFLPAKTGIRLLDELRTETDQQRQYRYSR